MSPRSIRLAALAAAAVAVWLGWSWWHSTERRIYRRLDALVSRLEKDGDESALAGAATAHGVLDFFAPGFIVRARPYEAELRDPQELMGAVMRFRGAARHVDVEISDRHLTLGPGERSGELVFLAAVTLDRGGGPARESWRVRSLWIEDGGEWRIAELELLQRVEGGAGLGF
ncbi:MAG TPA: hypothetical protein VGS57_15875 [Thermoanaerobaculia bacterium]|nr:hypothetical protein [Thermoanaerobaculia bacterium]